MGQCKLRNNNVSSIIVLMVAFAASRICAADVPVSEGALGPLTPLSAAYEGMTGEALFQKLLEGNRLREAGLQQYTAIRTYQVSSEEGKVHAQEVVRLDYQAPDQKKFLTVSESGSALVRELVLKRLIQSESETATGRAHHDSSLKPANYQFRLLGEQEVGPYHCLVAQATPKRKDKYLFEGRVWIDAKDFAIVRIAGEPAKSLSFWITRADFVRQYQKIGEFWLAQRDETLVHVRLYGTKILTIDHRDYVINGATGSIKEDLAGDRQMATRTSGTPHQSSEGLE